MEKEDPDPAGNYFERHQFNISTVCL